MSLSEFLQAVDQERFQIAKETEEGTPATSGFVILPTAKLEHKNEGSFDTYKRSGSRHVGSSRENRSWSSYTFNGAADFTEIGWLLAGALRIPTSALVAGATLAYQHVGNVLADAPNPTNSYTIEKGTSAYVRRIAGLRFDQFMVKSARSGTFEASGGGFGLAVEDSLTDDPAPAITAGATTIDKVPISGLQIGYYLTDDPADLDTAPLLADAFGGEISLGSIVNPIWTHNMKTSYEGVVEQEDQKGTSKMFLPVRQSYLNIAKELEAGKIYYMRMKILGPEIETGHNYLVQFDLAVTVEAKRTEQKEQNALAVQLPFVWADDPEWGKVMAYKIVNKLTAY